MGIENIRALVRPLVTVLFASAFVALTFKGMIPPEAFITVASAAIAWWFKERSDARAPAPSPAVTEREKTQQQPEG